MTAIVLRFCSEFQVNSVSKIVLHITHTHLRLRSFPSISRKNKKIGKFEKKLLQDGDLYSLIDGEFRINIDNNRAVETLVYSLHIFGLLV